MITASTKRWIKAPFRALGVDLVVRRPYPLQFLASYSVQTILDVGAHEGGFAADVRAILPKAMLHSFEPVSQAFDALKQREARDRNFKAWKLAIGDRGGSCVMHVNAMSASSSVLNMGRLNDYCPAARIEHEETVEMSTLDDWAQGVDLKEPILLKADVQGFEHSVLVGAEQLLQRTCVVILEVSFEEFYVGQPLFDVIHQHMRSAGFCLSGMYGPWYDPQTARQIQSNAIFHRDPNADHA